MKLLYVNVSCEDSLHVSFETRKESEADYCFDLSFLTQYSETDERWENEGLLIKCNSSYPCKPEVIISKHEEKEEIEMDRFSLDRFSLDRYMEWEKRQDEKFYSWRTILNLI